LKIGRSWSLIDDIGDFGLKGLHKWISFCYSANSLTSKLTFVSLLSQRLVFFNSSRIILDKQIVIGGEEQRPFSGWITDLNIWSKELSIESMKSFVSCSPVQPSPDLLQWESLKLLWLGNRVTEKYLSRDEICSARKDDEQILIFISFKLTFEESIKTCSVLGGKLGGGKDFKTFGEKIQQLDNRCDENYWLPFIKDEYGDLIDINTNETVLSEIPWADGQPNGDTNQPCVCTNKINNHSNILDIECTLRNCFGCFFNSLQIYRAKGTCMDGNDVDDKYILKSDPFVKGYHMFQGISGVSVIRNFSDNIKWGILNGANSDTQLAEYEPKSNNFFFPLGIQRWSLSKSSFCKDASNFINITLSKVKVENKFK